MKYRCLWRVEIFRQVVIEDPSPKAYRPAPLIANGENYPVTETIVVTALIFFKCRADFR